ncbi:serine hydrolase [Paenibacillus algorifonticola]|uniref:serine hydrolase domain-containing protein n=1 Tax=Paenibacillus algorifonticola TaxID=684063 RepID=UPI003D2C97AF
MNLSSLLPAIEPLDLRSCLVSYNGKLIIEHYRNDRTREEVAKVNSCTKSVVSALICIAMDKQLLPEASTPAALFFPQLAEDSDPRKQAITLEHLLTMSAGFSWTEFGGQNSFPRMTQTSNWLQFALEQPLSDEPGSRMEYNSGISQMLSAMLVQASGMTTAAFAERYLFQPLGISQYEWEHDPQGIHTGGFGLRLLPADMLKLGQLYLQQGVWKGQQLIPQALIQRSVYPAIAAESPRPGQYGWHWWVDSFSSGSESASSSAFDFYYALGFGGQTITVVPSLNIVAVVTNDRLKRGKPPADVFRHHIAPLLAQQ